MLNFSNGQVSALADLTLGYTASGEGGLNLQGVGTNVDISTLLTGSGKASISISGGAILKSPFVILQSNASRPTTISVSGQGSKFDVSFMTAEHTTFAVSDSAFIGKDGGSNLSLQNSSLNLSTNAVAVVDTLSISKSSVLVESGAHFGPATDHQGDLWLNGSSVVVRSGASFTTGTISDDFHNSSRSSITITGANSLMRTVSLTMSNLDLTVSNGGRLDASYVNSSTGSRMLNSGGAVILTGGGPGYMDVFGDGLTLRDGGYLSANQLYVGSTVRVEGVDSILDTKHIYGNGSLVFAHQRPESAPYYLTYTPTGSASVTASTQSGTPISITFQPELVFESGVTVMNQSNPDFNGKVRVAGGHLVTQASQALGISALTVQSGVMEARETLSVSRFDWQGGSIKAQPATGSHIDVAIRQQLESSTYVNDQLQETYRQIGTGAFTTTSGAGHFLIDADGLRSQSYELIRYQSTNFSAANATATFISDLQATYDHTFELRNNSLWLNVEAIVVSGNLLQNSGPANVLEFTTLQVSGQATTGSGTEANTIYGLRFEDQSVLDLYGPLTITSGKIRTQGSATINGFTLLAPNGLHFSGFGHLSINSDVEVQGPVTFGDGTVSFNGEFSAPSSTIEEGGFLGGSGTLPTNVVNHGTVAPGNSPGTLTIFGNYTQSSTGNFDFEAASARSFDRLVVSKTAKLDGKLRVQGYNGFKFERGQSFRFLEASEVKGKFADGEVLGSNLVALVTYVEQEATLHLLNSDYTTAAKNENQYSIAKALNRSVRDFDTPYQREKLAMGVLSDAQLTPVLDQLLPTYTEAALASAVELSQNHGAQIHQYLSARRLSDRLKKPATVVAPAAPAAVSAKSTKQVETVEPVAAPSGPQWNAWHQASGLYSQGGVSLNASEQFDSGTLMIGADHALSDAVSVGVFTSFQASWADYANQGSIDSEAIRFGLYGTVDVGGLYLNAAAGYGDLEYDFNRPVRVNTFSKTAKSDPEGSEFFGLVGAGFDQRVGNWTFGPQVSLQYSHVTLDGSDERGAGLYNLAIDKASTESLRTQVGGRVAYEFAVKENLTFIPEVRAFWQHEFLNGDDPIRAALDSGEDFRYLPNARGNVDTLFVGAGVGVKVGERLYGNLYYNTDFGRSESNHTISLNVSYKF